MPYAPSLGCLLKLNEEIQEPLTFRSNALLIVGGMCWFNFINWKKVKANLPYEKQLCCCWLEPLCLEKVLLRRAPSVYCMKYLSCKEKHTPWSKMIWPGGQSCGRILWKSVSSSFRSNGVLGRLLCLSCCVCKVKAIQLKLLWAHNRVCRLLKR